MTNIQPDLFGLMISIELFQGDHLTWLIGTVILHADMMQPDEAGMKPRPLLQVASVASG